MGLNPTLAPKINNTQEGTSGSEELFKVSQKMRGSVFATATVSTAASGSNSFSPQIKIWVDTGNLLTIGMCGSESFFFESGGKVWGFIAAKFSNG